jgi:uncharacterized protein YegP (UPF0339 family)
MAQTFSVSIRIYPDRAKQWRWQLLASNGRILADSGESYTRRRDCVRAVARVVALVRTVNLGTLRQKDRP